MLKTSLKIVSLSLAIAVVSGCSNSESNESQSKTVESKSSEKSVLIECKADEWDKGDKFNATIEVFPMTKEVLDSINFKEKESMKTYAKVKNIEYGSSWKLLKDCQPIKKNQILFSYSLFSLDEIKEKESKGEDFELFAKGQDVCNQAIYIITDKSNIKSKLSREIPYGMDDFKTLSSTCQVVK